MPDTSVAAPPAPELSAEAKKKAADASKHLLGAFGQVTSILMRSAQYRKQTLADLEWLVVPAVTTGQYALAEAQSKASGMMVPVGALLWASVSPEVDKRLTETTEVPMRLKPEEWRCGDILWVIDGVGEQQVVQAMLKKRIGPAGK
jgi:cytolysin-activating lysine-acyltransferase